MYYIIMYDISSQKRLNKVAKILLDYAVRIQFSVFIADIELSIFEQLERRISKVIDVNEDRIRYFTLCKKCFNNKVFFGMGEIEQKHSFIIL